MFDNWIKPICSEANGVCVNVVRNLNPSILHENIDQILVNSLLGLLNCEIGGLECHIFTTEYKTRVH